MKPVLLNVLFAWGGGSKPIAPWKLILFFAFVLAVVIYERFFSPRK